MGLFDKFKKVKIDYEIIKNSFYENFKEAIIKFAKTTANNQVYAIVFDCDDENGQICIRYASEEDFKERMNDYEKYKNMFQKYEKYDVVAYKYSFGDFKFIDYEECSEMKHFNDTYYYYITEDNYYGEDNPFEIIVKENKAINIKEDINSLKELWETLIIENIHKLVNEELGISKTKDFIMFMVKHDESDEDIKKDIKKTVNEINYKNAFTNNNLVKRDKNEEETNFEHEKENAIKVLKDILKALHEKRYSDVINYVDESKIDNLEDFLLESVQKYLDINNINTTVDEYGMECNFHPQYEYSQITIRKYNDNGDFYIEYDLTSNGEPIDLALQLDFKHTEDGLKCIFENIDPQ